MQHLSRNPFLAFSLNFIDAFISDIYTCVKVYTYSVNMMLSSQNGRLRKNFALIRTAN